jgi:hypothetical protein
VAQQGPQPPRSSRLSARSNSPRWNEADYPDDNEEPPPWAGLAVDPLRAGAPRRDAGYPDARYPDAEHRAAGYSPPPDDDDELPAPQVRPRGRQAAARARRAHRRI